MCWAMENENRRSGYLHKGLKAFIGGHHNVDRAGIEYINGLCRKNEEI